MKTNAFGMPTVMVWGEILCSIVSGERFSHREIKGYVHWRRLPVLPQVPVVVHGEDAAQVKAGDILYIHTEERQKVALVALGNSCFLALTHMMAE